MIDADYCVIGAGFAGLSAALRLKQADRSVVVLEARDRVGGRTFTQTLDDGTWIDRGGAWTGPGQHRIHALMREFGVGGYQQFRDGESMMVVDGKQYRYSGTIPMTMSPWAVANLGAVMLELGRLCRSIPLAEPWRAKHAQKWDQISLAHWLRTHSLSKAAHDLLDTAISGCYTSAGSEVSMLWMLFQFASAGGPNFVFSVEDGSQDSRVVGGMGAVSNPIAAELGDSLLLSHPVRRIEHDPQGVTVHTDGATVRAGRAIVAVPLAVADRIDYEPMLPVDREFLHRRVPSGAIFKINVVYDEPFWRADGLTGQSAAPGTPAPVTIEACTDAARPGVMCVISEGPVARHLCTLDEKARRRAVLDELVARFGPKAAVPQHYLEQNWTVERFSGGGMIGHMGTGVLTEFGHALRQPCGRIHWAGTESSTDMCGWIDGAVRSGERAAAEVLAADAAATRP